MEAQLQKQETIVGNHNIMAAETPFGWVLIGSIKAPPEHKQGKANTREELGKRVCRTIAQIKRPPKPTTDDEDPFGDPEYQQMMHEAKQNEINFQSTREDELPGYSKDDRLFFEKVIPQVRQRQDGMLEFPLPFRSESPEFEYNRAVALNRTRSTLDNMKKKHPKVFQSSLEKFQKNIETDSLSWEIGRASCRERV